MLLCNLDLVSQKNAPACILWRLAAIPVLSYAGRRIVFDSQYALQRNKIRLLVKAGGRLALSLSLFEDEA